MAGRELNEALIYAPPSKGDRIAMARRIAPRVLAVAALMPFEFTQGALARQLDINVGKMSQCVGELEGRGWIDIRSRTVGQGQTGKALGVSGQFWHDRSIAETAAVGHSAKLAETYGNACQAFEADYRLSETSDSDQYIAYRLVWVGSIGVLGSVLDLSEYGTWLPDAAGWDTLIRTSMPPLAVQR